MVVKFLLYVLVSLSLLKNLKHFTQFLTTDFDKNIPDMLVTTVDQHDAFANVEIEKSIYLEDDVDPIIMDAFHYM